MNGKRKDSYIDNRALPLLAILALAIIALPSFLRMGDAEGAIGAPVSATVTTGTNGVLIAPPNFFSTNAPTMISALTNAGFTPGGSSAVTLNGDVSGSGTGTVGVTVQNASHLTNFPSATVMGLGSLATATLTSPLAYSSGTVSLAQNGSGDLNNYTMPSNSVMLVFGDSIATSFAVGSDSLTWMYSLSLQFPTMDIYSFGVVSETSAGGISHLSAGNASYHKFSNGTITTGSGTFTAILSGYSGAKFAMANYGANDGLASNSISASQFGTNMASIYSSLNALGCKIVGASILPRYGIGSSAPGFAQSAYNSQVRLLGPPYVTSGTSCWNLFADLAAAFSNPDTTLFVDGVHPNGAGNKVYANQIYRAITSQNVASIGSPSSVNVDANGNALIPYSGVVINSLSTPNASSGQILTVGTRGGTGTPITVDNGTVTIVSVDRLGNYYSPNGALNLNTPSSPAVGTAVLVVGSRAGSEKLINFDNGSSAIAWFDSKAGINLSNLSSCNGISINSPTAASGSTCMTLGSRGGSNDLIDGDNGSSRTFTLNSSGAISQCAGVTSSGNFVGSAAGATLSIKGGSNAASGTVTLSSGSGTWTSTAITTSSIFWEPTLITASGTAGAVSIQVTGTGTAVLSGAATDNGTYNVGLAIGKQ